MWIKATLGYSKDQHAEKPEHVFVFFLKKLSLKYVFEERTKEHTKSLNYWVFSLYFLL